MPAIVRYSPWSMLRGIQDEVNQLFNQNLTEKGMNSQWTPHVDITEESDKYKIIADIPGVKTSDIKVNLENNILTIQGERKTESKKEQEGFTRIERFSGNFSRQFSLPENIDEKKIQAKCKEGVLEIVIPKKTPNESKTMEIKVEG